MKPDKLHDYLKRLKLEELKDLFKQTLGEGSATPRTKDAIIAKLMDDSPKVIKALGGAPRWIDQPSTHIYGIISIIGTAIALLPFFWRSSVATESPQIDSLRKQQVVDRVERIRASKPVIQTEASAGRVFDSLPKSTASGFELLEHTVVCDLRSYKPVPSVDRDKMLSPVVQHIRQRIKKLDDSERYLLAAHTSGIDVFCDSTTHALAVHASDVRRPVAEKYTVKPRMLEFNVSAEPTGSEFTLEATKTFWNAFNNEDQSWVGLIVGLPTRTIGYLVVFPRDKPFTSFKHFVDDEHRNRIGLPAVHYVLEDPEKRWIWWSIVDPKPRHTYNIDWEW